MVFLCQCNSLSNASSSALSPSPVCFLPSPSKMPLIRVLSNQRANAHAHHTTAQIPTPVHARLLCVSRNAKTSPPQLYASFRDHKITCLRSMEHTAHARIRSVHASSIAYSHMVPVRRATERVNGIGMTEGVTHHRREDISDLVSYLLRSPGDRLQV